ncbi:hypothetical protein [Propionivibrio sp.]|uniref:hypothetical protein n=1 Tax=Propionivibrio sp. TaxID=2212460 RepID=UPI0026196F84|nr:hypothetical protein [Propionivibrio sp.]
MNEEFVKLNARLAKLEKDYADLLEGGDETKRRYSSLLTMVRELTTNTVQASAKAAESAEKSLVAGHLAAQAAKDAIIMGAIQVADMALEAAKASADAAAEAAVAAAEAGQLHQIPFNPRRLAR